MNMNEKPKTRKSNDLIKLTKHKQPVKMNIGNFINCIIN
jgi:hypothetical protein